jgi:hypothetical protein
MYLLANDFQKALSDCAVHRRGIDGRVRSAKSTADAESGAERSTEKDRRMGRPAERAGRNSSLNIEKWRHLGNPDQGFGQDADIPRKRDERRYFIQEKRAGRDHSFRKRRADRKEMVRGQKGLFADPEERRILPGLIGLLPLI